MPLQLSQLLRFLCPWGIYTSSKHISLGQSFEKVNYGLLLPMSSDQFQGSVSILCLSSVLPLLLSQGFASFWMNPDNIRVKSFHSAAWSKFGIKCRDATAVHRGAFSFSVNIVHTVQGLLREDQASGLLGHSLGWDTVTLLMLAIRPRFSFNYLSSLCSIPLYPDSCLTWGPALSPRWWQGPGSLLAGWL